MTEPLLLTSWAVCGIAAGAARFVPVPLLDEVIRSQAARTAVVRTVRAHGWDGDVDLLAPLWGEPDDGRSGVRRRLAGLSSKVLLFPVRKYAAVFGAVRGVPTDVLRVVLLGRTVERRLERGELAVAERVPDEARAVRRALDEAIEGVDLRLLTAALGDVLSQTRGLTSAAVGLARRRSASTDPDAGLDPDGPMAEGAQRVTEVLRRPDVAQLLDRVDAQVDARLAARG